MSETPPSDRIRWELGHRPAIDGLRAFAIIAVVGVHVATILIPTLAGKYFVGGVLGVNMFFVVSGLLITAILLREHQRFGKISFGSFWKRRSLRLFPALYVVLIAQFIYTIYKSDPTSMTLKGDALIVIYVSNWAWIHQWPQPFGMGVTWSLAVKEQFYVVWPVVLLLLLKLRQRWIIPAVATAIGIASAAYRWHLQHSTANWIPPIASTWANIDSLMAGVLLASILHAGWRPPRLLIKLLIVPAIWYLAREIETYSTQWRILGHTFSFGKIMVPLAAASTVILILAALEPDDLVYRAFMIRPLRWLGRLSYSIYLWHVLVFSVINRSQRIPNHSERLLVALVVSLVFAVGSYYAIERPFIALAHRPGKRRADVPAPARAPSSGLAGIGSIDS